MPDFSFMPLPFFYIEESHPLHSIVELDEDNARHIVQVLRMRVGEQLNLTDGKGNLLTAEIVNDNKKKCEVSITNSKSETKNQRSISIAISILKNANRFEWFLEKATEIGVTEIIPLICERTERQHFRFDRMKNILVSAMLQSQQCWLPVLREPQKFTDLCNSGFSGHNKLIAHCDEGNKQVINPQILKSDNSIILIGPEGDFTSEEIQLALQQGFIPVTLGDTRLRTETAGVVAATLLRLS